VRKESTGALVVTCCAALCLASISTALAVRPPYKIADLAWIAGSWRTASGQPPQIEEHWTQPAGGTMLGMGRAVAGDRTVEFEYLRLEERNGEIYYVAYPNAKCPGTDFKLTRLSPQEAVFENPAHDFPKRVIYRKGANGSLTASIDGGEGAKAIKFEYLPIK
jgi:Domain of unknown function (DUF6265)